MMRRFGLYFLAIGILFYNTVWSLTMDTKRLDNGLTVVLVNDPSSALASVRTFVKTGSIDEAPYLGSGLSHYLEHLVAGGTTSKRPESEYKQLIAKLGGAYNAYTTLDHTSYFVNTVPEELSTALNIIYEWMFYCQFDPKEFDRERDVITREIERSDANVGRQFYQLCSDNFYKVSPLRYPVIGYLDNFKEVSREALVDYYKAKYVPSNMILVIGGAFDSAKVMAQVDSTFGKISHVSAPLQVYQPEPLPFTTRYLTGVGDTTVTYLSFRFPTVDLFSKDLYPLDLLEFVLANGEDSILHRRLVEDGQLAYSVRASSYTPSTSTGYFEVTLELDLAKKDKAQAELFTILDEVKRGKLDKKLVERAKKQKVAEDIFSISTIDDKVSRFGMGYMYGHSTSFFDDYLRHFKSVTPEDVERVATQFLQPDRMVVTMMTPKVALPPTKSVTSDPLASIGVGPRMVTLSSGVRVILEQNTALPKVFAKIFVTGGSRQDKPETQGLGYMVSDLLGKGSQKYSKQQIRTLIEDRGADLSASIGNNTLYYNLDSLSDDFNELFPVFLETFLHAKFDAEDLEETRRQMLKSIASRQDDWMRYAMYRFKQVFYKGHPYGASVLGENESVNRLTLDDVTQYYAHLFDNADIVISVVGQFDEAYVLSQLEKAFTKVKVSQQNVFGQFNRLPHTESASHEFSIPQDVAGVLIGYDGLDYSDPKEIVALDLMDTVLSGANYPGGRLHSLLRDKGYVYMVHAAGQTGIEPGHYLIYALTNRQSKEDVKKVILDQIKDLQNKLISDHEFNEALAQLRYSYKDQVESLESRGSLYVTDELYGLGHAYSLGQSAKYLSELTKEDVQRMAKKILVHPQIFDFVGPVAK